MHFFFILKGLRKLATYVFLILTLLQITDCFSILSFHSFNYSTEKLSKECRIAFSDFCVIRRKHILTKNVLGLLKRRNNLFLRKAAFVSPAQEKLAKLNDGKDRSGSYFIAYICGRQKWMEVGRFYDLFRIHQEVGRQIYLHRIIRYETADGTLLSGQPYLTNVRVVATVLKHFRGHKIYIAKYKPKKHYRRLMGHRQELTRIKIDRVEVLGMAEIDKWEEMNTIQNFLEDNPLYCMLQRIQRTEKPSTVIKKMKKFALQPIIKDELKQLGDDPLANFDPIVNEKEIERILMYQ